MGKIVQVLSFFFGGGEGGIQFKLKFLVPVHAKNF